MAYFNPENVVLKINGRVVTGFATDEAFVMAEHPAWKHFEEVRASEERRIRQIANPAERARQFEHFDKWSKDEVEVIKMLIKNQESTTADMYEELKYVGRTY